MNTLDEKMTLKQVLKEIELYVDEFSRDTGRMIEDLPVPVDSYTSTLLSKYGADGDYLSNLKMNVFRVMSNSGCAIVGTAGNIFNYALNKRIKEGDER